MRIMTRTQYDAICDIVTDLQTENEKLRKKNTELKECLEEKKQIIQYLNVCINKANKRYLELIKKQSNLFPNVLEYISCVGSLDFPATQKPEDKFI